MTLVAAAFVAAIVADQASKAVAVGLLSDGRLHIVAWRSGVRRVHNSRGGLVALPLRWAAVAWIAALALVALLVSRESPAQGAACAVGLGLLLGGAAGNLADRALRGAVVDFVALRSWPTFNIADLAMVAGAVLLVGGVV